VTGTVVEFVRNSAFDTHNYFDNPDAPVPPLRQHQFGASVGGPLRRERSFFFTNYEGQRVRSSSTQTFSVPTAALRAGDFSGGSTLCDPLAAGAVTGCVPFANNQIPASRIDPIARAFLGHVPLPSGPGAVQNLRAVGKQIADMDQFSLRIDQRLTLQDQLFGRFTAYDVSDEQPFGTEPAQRNTCAGFRPHGDDDE
jgi:hypothetical protein